MLPLVLDLRHCDNMALMAQFPDKYFKLAIVDPPYGINGNSHRKNKSRGKLALAKDYPTHLWDQPIPDDQYFKELFRISENQIIFGGNYFPQLTTPHKTPRRDTITIWMEEHPNGWFVWDKVNGDTSYNDYELAWTSFKDKPSFIYKFMWNGMMQGGSIFNGHIMEGKKELNQKRIHPAEKPTMLYKFILHTYSKPGDINLDTHLGSGSNAIAHIDFGCSLVAAEKEYDHYSDAMKRIANHQNQLKLF